MNTKAAVILMIGLLGSPVAYNFTQPVWEKATTNGMGFCFNRRTGEWFSLRGGGIQQPGETISDLGPATTSRQLVQTEK